MQKYYTADFLSKRTVKNTGQIEQVYVKDSQPPLDMVCPEIVNMVLGSVEVHDGGLLHFYFLDGTELEIETEE